MNMLAAALMAASATIIALLGVLHLALTFSGSRLHPRDPQLAESMKAVSPVITRQTTMWRAWIGFNASHSIGAILFGAVYGTLAVRHSAFLFASVPLLVIGGALLAGYLFLGKRYWFRAPFRSIIAASAFYVAALVVHWFG